MKWLNLTGDARGKLLTARAIATIRGGAFRAPHHTVSAVGLLSELDLAQGGVLYLDEAHLFNRDALYSMITRWDLHRRGGVKVALIIVDDRERRISSGGFPFDAAALEWSETDASAVARLGEVLR